MADYFPTQQNGSTKLSGIIILIVQVLIPNSMTTVQLTQTSSNILGKLNNTRVCKSTFLAPAQKSFVEKRDRYIETETRIGAHDLFSMFTADIIKKEAMFVR